VGFGKKTRRTIPPKLASQSQFTYLACRDEPVELVEGSTLHHIQTHCGFVSIESNPGSGHVKELQDVYGQTRGHTRPRIQSELEDLLAALQPDIPSCRPARNLFDLFPITKA